jgi:NAD(P)-dependent dehydrogenase (short-subunit alcohol dehydrogenase family)
MTLQGRRIVVLGGSSGIGLAVAPGGGARGRHGGHRFEPAGAS